MEIPSSGAFSAAVSKPEGCGIVLWSTFIQSFVRGLFSFIRSRREWNEREIDLECDLSSLCLRFDAYADSVECDSATQFNVHCSGPSTKSLNFFSPPLQKFTSRNEAPRLFPPSMVFLPPRSKFPILMQIDSLCWWLPAEIKCHNEYFSLLADFLGLLFLTSNRFSFDRFRIVLINAQ